MNARKCKEHVVYSIKLLISIFVHQKQQAELT